MAFGPLLTWDNVTLDEVCNADETSCLERKAGLFFDATVNGWKAKVTEELAKQLCAFSNAETGHIVFGVREKPTVELDDGVPLLIGRESIKDWVEALAPRLVEPPVIGVQARVLRREGFHRADRGVLVVEVPLSGARPHWVPANPNVAYIRAGAHSAPMSHHTLLDIANRQDAAVGEVFDLHVRGLTFTRAMPFTWTCFVSPSVGLVSAGGACRDWSVELAVEPERGTFPSTPHGLASPSDATFQIEGKGPLLPGRRTRLCLPGGTHLGLVGGETIVSVTLFAAGARPIRRSFRIATGNDSKGRPDETLLPVEMIPAGKCGF